MVSRVNCPPDITLSESDEQRARERQRTRRALLELSQLSAPNTELGNIQVENGGGADTHASDRRFGQNSEPLYLAEPNSSAYMMSVNVRNQYRIQEEDEGQDQGVEEPSEPSNFRRERHERLQPRNNSPEPEVYRLSSGHFERFGDSDGNGTRQEEPRVEEGDTEDGDGQFYMLGGMGVYNDNDQTESGLGSIRGLNRLQGRDLDLDFDISLDLVVDLDDGDDDPNHGVVGSDDQVRYMFYRGYANVEDEDVDEDDDEEQGRSGGYIYDEDDGEEDEEAEEEEEQEEEEEEEEEEERGEEEDAEREEQEDDDEALQQGPDTRIYMNRNTDDEEEEEDIDDERALLLRTNNLGAYGLGISEEEEQGRGDNYNRSGHMSSSETGPDGGSVRAAVEREMSSLLRQQKLRHTPSKEKLRSMARHSSWVAAGSKFTGVYKPRLNLNSYRNELITNAKPQVVSANVRSVNRDSGHVSGIIRGAPFDADGSEFEGNIVEPSDFLAWIAKKVSPQRKSTISSTARNSTQQPVRSSHESEARQSTPMTRFVPRLPSFASRLNTLDSDIAPAVGYREHFSRDESSYERSNNNSRRTTTVSTTPVPTVSPTANNSNLSLLNQHIPVTTPNRAFLQHQHNHMGLSQGLSQWHRPRIDTHSSAPFGTMAAASFRDLESQLFFRLPNPPSPLNVHNDRLPRELDNSHESHGRTLAAARSPASGHDISGIGINTNSEANTSSNTRLTDNDNLSAVSNTNNETTRGSYSRVSPRSPRTRRMSSSIPVTVSSRRQQQADSLPPINSFSARSSWDARRRNSRDWARSSNVAATSGDSSINSNAHTADSANTEEIPAWIPPALPFSQSSARPVSSPRGSGTGQSATNSTTYLERVARNFSMLSPEHLRNIGEAKFAQDFERDKFCMIWTIQMGAGQESDHYYVIIDHRDGTLDAINVSNACHGEDQYEKLRMEPVQRRTFPALSLCP